MSQETKHARRRNWSEDEVILMCKFIETKKHIIRAKFSANVSTQSKKAAWDNITAQLNASYPSVKRERSEVEKKWHNVHSKSKKELTEHSKNSVKTGGGPPPKPLSVISQCVADIIGEDNVAIQGIGDILDSSFYQVTSLNDESTSASEIGLPEQVVYNIEDMCNMLPSTSTKPVSSKRPIEENVVNVNEGKKIKLQIENLNIEKENLLLKNEYLKLKLKVLKQKMSPEN